MAFTHSNGQGGPGPFLSDSPPGIWRLTIQCMSTQARVLMWPGVQAMWSSFSTSSALKDAGQLCGVCVGAARAAGLFPQSLQGLLVLPPLLLVNGVQLEEQQA